MTNQSNNLDTLSDQYTIHTESDLRRIIPNYPSILDKRVQSTLDIFSLEFLEKSCVVIIGTSLCGIKMTPLNYRESISVDSISSLTLQHLPSGFQFSSDIERCQGSLFFMIPGVGHCLRINGTLAECTPDRYQFNISKVYFHCARAAARSELWSLNHLSKEMLKLSDQNIIQHSSYALLKTQNSKHETEISPRGDEPGFIKPLSEDTLFLPERPGNKVAVSIRNIIDEPSVELLLMVPGHTATLNIMGSAYVTHQPSILNRCVVNGKTPKVGIVVKIKEKQFQFEKVLADSGLWQAQNQIDQSAITPFSKALSSHMNGIGLLGKATNLIVDSIVKHDMKNLY